MNQIQLGHASLVVLHLFGQGDRSPVELLMLLSQFKYARKRRPLKEGYLWHTLYLQSYKH